MEALYYFFAVICRGPAFYFQPLFLDPQWPSFPSVAYELKGSYLFYVGENQCKVCEYDGVESVAPQRGWSALRCSTVTPGKFLLEVALLQGL